MVYADAMAADDEVSRLVQELDFPTILVTRSRAEAPPPGFGSAVWVSVPDVQMSRAGQVKTALLVCLARGELHKGDGLIVYHQDEQFDLRPGNRFAGRIIARAVWRH